MVSVTGYAQTTTWAPRTDFRGVAEHRDTEHCPARRTVVIAATGPESTHRMGADTIDSLSGAGAMVATSAGSRMIPDGFGNGRHLPEPRCHYRTCDGC